MRPIRSVLLPGLAGTVLAGAVFAGAAIAASDTAHVLLVRLPDGSVERIRYTGDVAPRVVLVPAAASADPFAAMSGGAGSPFAMMDRISAELDRQASAMMRQAATLAARAPSPAVDGAAMRMVSGGAMPAGTTSYSIVSTTMNGKTCTRSSRLIAGTAGAKPRLVSQSSGECGGTAAPAAPAGAAPARMAAPPRAPAPGTI